MTNITSTSKSCESKAIIRKKEDEAYQLEKEQRRKEIEAELATQKPWLEELALCDVLIKYLTGLLQKKFQQLNRQAYSKEGQLKTGR